MTAQPTKKDFKMLKLTRKPDDSILIYTSDGVIEVTVLRVQGCQVGIGIEAPQSVNIVRAELEEQRPHEIVRSL
jgi:carbon storage regulator CsrA